MKNLLFIAVLFIVPNFLFSQKNIVNYENNYSLKIDNQWKRISQNEVDSWSKNISPNISYNEGFYPIIPRNKNRDDGWGYPYILTDFFPMRIKENEYEAISVKLSQSFDIAIDYIYSSENLTVENIVINSSNFNKAKKELTVKFQVYDPDVGNVIGIGKFFFQSSGILGIYCYESKKYFSQTLPIFQNIFRSVKLF